ncbi:MAG: hypothetical protein JW993_11390, partial [Sedimentisphaerales bacterium]|nr:hypothetical protein [Sedimentisphaerales bacterium]
LPKHPSEGWYASLDTTSTLPLQKLRKFTALEQQYGYRRRGRSEVLGFQRNPNRGTMEETIEIGTKRLSGPAKAVGLPLAFGIVRIAIRATNDRIH